MAEPHSDATRELGRRVRARREALGKSQEQLAATSGLHWTFVSQVERGLRNPRLDNLIKLAEGLETDPGKLVTGMRSSGLTPDAGDPVR